MWPRRRRISKINKENDGSSGTESRSKSMDRIYSNLLKLFECSQGTKLETLMTPVSSWYERLLKNAIRYFFREGANNGNGKELYAKNNVSVLGVHGVPAVTERSEATRSQCHRQW